MEIGDDLTVFGKRRIHIWLRDKHYLVIFLAPAIICLVVVTIYPLIFSVKSSFFAWDLMNPGSESSFIGFRNYTTILKSVDFWNALKVTLEYTLLSVSLSMVFGTAMAFLFYQNLFGTWPVRTLMIAGMVISPVIVGTTWRLLYSPDFGLINYFLGVIGLGRHAFLAQGNTVIPALVITDVWQWSPLIMVIVLAAIQGLPTDEYEASKIDGANSFQSFIHITIPLLKPALLLALLIRIMDCFRTFDTIYAMTGGGPGTKSQNLNILMYNTGFQFFQVSKVTAMAVISLIIITVISMLLVKAIRTDSAVL